MCVESYKIISVISQKQVEHSLYLKNYQIFNTAFNKKLINSESEIQSNEAIISLLLNPDKF